MSKSINIIEIKARTSETDRIRDIIIEKDAIFKGIDHQVDTYFNVPKGRLKLREGNIESTLIQYDRPNQLGPKQSKVKLYKPQAASALKEVLAESIGVWKIVDKKREIYFVDNVKFHLDVVKNLGQFVEIEAIDEDGSIGLSKIKEQCDHYIKLFNILDEDLIECSYSDMV